MNIAFGTGPDGKAALDRQDVINVALSNSRSTEQNPFAWFERVGHTASILGCDIGAIALPYLFIDPDGVAIMAVTSAAHRPDERALAAAAGVSSLRFASEIDPAMLQSRGPDWLAEKHSYFDLELGRRPIAFVLIDDHAVVRVRPDELCRMLGAEPVDVAGVSRWQHRVAIVSGGPTVPEPDWVGPLSEQLNLAGVFVAMISLSDLEMQSLGRSFSHILLHSIEAARAADLLVAMWPCAGRALKLRVVGSTKNRSTVEALGPVPPEGRGPSGPMRSSTSTAMRRIGRGESFAPGGKVSRTGSGADSTNVTILGVRGEDGPAPGEASIRELVLWCLDYDDDVSRQRSGPEHD
jgi:hypothetical protein